MAITFRFLFCCWIFLTGSTTTAQTVRNNLSLSEDPVAGSFPLINKAGIPTLYYDANDAKVVKIAAEAFASDMNLLSGKQIRLNASGTITDELPIIIGTIGHSKLIDELIKQKVLDVSPITNKWESFTIQIIKQNPGSSTSRLPFAGRALVIAGSDRRGTAYGIFHLSRAMGVSPFVWWADILPGKKNELFVSGTYVSTGPSVQYRGIFINDEDWGLQPWAAKKIDTALKDIGPKTYAKVFELLLRLKANYIWPAMQPCTKAFYYYKENPKVADDYAIVVGSSDAEPMFVWPDDNHGYIRQLPNEAEQKRRGDHGVYYHLSYSGSPADYLWLSSISPALIGYEMKKAYDHNAKKLWVFNVGDIKPAELEMQFALDMAWDISYYNSIDPYSYIKKWAAETFGPGVAGDIIKIKDLYYQLAASGKPEHLNLLKFSAKEIDQRIEACQKLSDLTDTCAQKIGEAQKDAFYQLIKYPVTAVYLMNMKILNQQLAAQFMNKQDVGEAMAKLTIAQFAYSIIPEITEQYNRFIAKGKWNGIMSWKPRDQKIFDPPPVIDSLQPTVDSVLLKKQAREAQRVQIITARQLYNGKYIQGCLLLPGLGISGAALTPVANSTTSRIMYKTMLNAGTYNIIVKCLPTFSMDKDRQLNYNISLGGDIAQPVNVNSEADSPEWKENVLRGFSKAETVHTLNKSGITTIIIELKNKNLVISQVEIYKTQ